MLCAFWPVPDPPGGAGDVRSRGTTEVCNPRTDGPLLTHS